MRSYRPQWCRGPGVGALGGNDVALEGRAEGGKDQHLRTWTCASTTYESICV